MTQLTFTHANTKRPLIVTREHVWSIMDSDAHKCTMLVSIAGSLLPVAESIEEAKRLVYGADVLPLKPNSSNRRGK